MRILSSLIRKCLLFAPLLFSLCAYAASPSTLTQRKAKQVRGNKSAHQAQANAKAKAKAAGSTSAPSLCMTLQSTVYDTPLLIRNPNKGPDQPPYLMVDQNGKIQSQVKMMNSLAREPSALVIDRAGKISAIVKYFGATKKLEEESREVIIRTQCPFSWTGGYNGQLICVNPFKTVASVYPAGTVFYVPELVGKKYPIYPGQPFSQWHKHDGIVIGADWGNGVKDPHHLDFFSGAIQAYDSNNPFRLLLEKDKNKKHTFCRLNPSKTAYFLNKNKFPKMPTPPIEILTDSDLSVAVGGRRNLEQAFLAVAQMTSAPHPHPQLQPQPRRPLVAAAEQASANGSGQSHVRQVVHVFIADQMLPGMEEGEGAMP